MWTKKEIAEFKESVRKEGGDSIIKVPFPIPSIFIHFKISFLS